MYVGVAAYALATLSALVATRAGPAGYIAAALLYASVTVAYVAFAAGLWRFRSVPASTGAARLARQSFVWFAATPLLTLVLPSSLIGTALGLGALDDGRFGHLIPFTLVFALAMALWWLAPIALGGACLTLLVRALSATLCSLGETPPAWAPKAVRAYITLKILLIVGAMGHARDGGSDVMVFKLAADCALVLALAPIMGRAATVLARQESPESALR